MWARVTKTILFAPNIACPGFPPFQMAIDGSKYLKQTHESNFDLVSECGNLQSLKLAIFERIVTKIQPRQPKIEHFA